MPWADAGVGGGGDGGVGGEGLAAQERLLDEPVREPGDDDGEGGAEAEEGVQREQGAVGGFWKKRGGAGVDHWHREAEGQAH